LARGLIHSQLGEYAAAIESYGAALRLRPDATAHEQRGWAYLQKDAAELALADFDTALKLEAKTYRVLCGRALARVKLRKVDEAVQDAETAVKLGKVTDPEPPLLAACVYARAAVQASRSVPDRRRGRSGVAYED